MSAFSVYLHLKICRIMQKPELTIVIPVFNAEKYISQTVESILSQTFQDWQLVIVDDGSTDSTSAICQRYASADPRIKVVRIDNSGPSAAKNLGISLAEGSYITFVDGDDEYGAVTTLEENMSILRSDSSIDILQFPYEQVSFKGRTKLRTPGHLGRIEGRSKVLSMIGENKIPGYLCHKIFKAEILNGKRLREDMRLTEDLWFLIDVVLDGAVFYISDCGSYKYFQRQGSLTTNKTQVKEHQALGTFMRLLDILHAEPGVPVEVSAGQFMRTLSLIVNLNALFGEDTKEHMSRLRPYTPPAKILLRPLRTSAKLKYILLRLTGYAHYVKFINWFRSV